MKTVPDNFVQIKGGTFIMGSPDSETDRHDSEVKHKVTVSSFYMSKYRVTQKEYEEVMGYNRSFFNDPNLPVGRVSWYEAIEYCNEKSIKEKLTPAYIIVKDRKDPNNKNKKDKVRWLVTWNKKANGYRLPTEAEWEYACRAGETTLFSTQVVTELVNIEGFVEGIRENIIPVGPFKPNPWGLYDLHGNVREWCWDWYGDYSNADQTDPDGAVSGAYRVVRGGYWSDNWLLRRFAYRSDDGPDLWLDNIGFRLVRPQYLGN